MNFIKCSNCNSSNIVFNGMFHDGTSKTYCQSCGMSSWARKREERQPEIFWEVTKPKK